MTTRLHATTWRAVCPKFGQDGHTTHVVVSRETFEYAEAGAAANDQLYERLAKGAKDSGSSQYSYYRSEIGWIVQKQTVPQWENV